MIGNLELQGCSWYDVKHQSTCPETLHQTLPASRVSWLMPNLMIQCAGPVQNLGILFCENAVIGMSDNEAHIENSPIPPLKEGIHLFFLSGIIQDFK